MLQEGDAGSDSDQEPQAGASAGEGTSILPDSEEEEEELPIFLWKPPQTTAALGEWEAHTRVK